MSLKDNIQGSVWNLTIYQNEKLRTSINMSFPLFVGAIFIIHYFQSNNLSFAIANIFAYFSAIFIHDLSHLIVLRNYGLNPSSIQVFPFGSYFQLEQKNDVKNNLIFLLPIFVSLSIAFFISAFLPENILESKDLFENFILHACAYNYFLGFINLLPVFPLDLFSALLNRNKKENSFNVQNLYKNSMLLASGLLFIVLFLINEVTLSIVTVTLALIAFGKHRSIQTEETLKLFNIMDVLIKKEQLMFLPSILSIEDALKKALNSFHEIFIVTQNEKTIGIISRTEIIKQATIDSSQYLVSITNKNLLKVNLDTKLSDLYLQMELGSKTLALVFENDVLVGLITKEKAIESVIIQNLLKNSKNQSPI